MTTANATMTPPIVADGEDVCPWPVTLPCPAPTTDDPCRKAACSTFHAQSEEMQQVALDSAIDHMRLLVGRFLGTCATRVRPCLSGPASCGCEGGSASRLGLPRRFSDLGTPRNLGVRPYIDSDGQWKNSACCEATPGCACADPCYIEVRGPVHRLLRITVDGVDLTLDGTEPQAVVVNHRLIQLVRDVEKGGETIAGPGADSCWLDCQDYTAADHAEGTVTIDYVRGTPLTARASLLTGILACEYAKSMCGDDSCRLPERATTVSREGVTIALSDTGEGLEDGLTGLTEVDTYVRALWAQARRLPPARVSSPDMPGFAGDDATLGTGPYHRTGASA